MSSLKRITNEIWEVCDIMKIGPALYLPVRMTVIRLGDSVFLHSPVEIDDETQRAIDELGEVRWIASPNLFHWAFFNAAAERWPTAERWGPRGLQKKRPEIELDHVYGNAADSWPDTLERVKLEGLKIREHVFVHHPSSTLIVTDLLFNMYEAENWLTKFLLAYVSNAFGGLRRSRLFGTMIYDDQAFSASIGRVATANFDRIVVAHGEVYEASDAPANFVKALGDWYLTEAPRTASEP